MESKGGVGKVSPAFWIPCVLNEIILERWEVITVTRDEVDNGLVKGVW